MQALKELVYVVNKSKLRGIDLLGFPFADDAKLNELYESISSGEVDSDDLAADRLFGTDAGEINYRKLKADLTHRLVNALFLIDVKQPSYNQRQRAYQESYKNWAAVRLLFGKNARTAGVYLAEKVLKYGESFEFTNLCLEVCRTLRLHYGAMVGDEKQYQVYNEKFHFYRELDYAESTAEAYYCELVIRHVKSRALKKNIPTLAQQYYNDLKPGLEKWESHDLHLYANLIKLIIYTSVNNYQKAIQVCEEAILFFEKKTFDARVPLQAFYYQQAICYIQLRQLNKQLFSNAKALKFLDEGTYNWYKFQETYVILGLHTQHYQWAYEIFSKAYQHKRFQFLPPDQQEYWKILEQYLHYLFLNNKIKINHQEASFSRLRLGRFLNQTPIFSKDKKGLNIPILIIQILFLVQQNRRSQTTDRIDAIEKYSERYLHNEYTIRSYFFIKMLLALPKNQFHPVAVQRKAQPYFDQLRKRSLEVSSQYFQVEIIPFEDLWEMVIQYLEKQLQKANKKKKDTN
ncbi:MAG: hypothetical protein ACK4TA_20420 [Saprospiraceae bacterium]